MKPYRSFKDILVTYDVDDLLMKQRKAPELAYMLQCLSGSMQMDYAGRRITLSEGDLLFSPSDRVPENMLRSDDFACQIFAIEVKTLDDILYACLREEKGWMEKLRYIMSHPVVHLTPRQIDLIEAYRVLVRFYQQEDSRYKKRVAFLQGQAIIFELMSWVAEKMANEEEPREEKGIREMGTDARLNQLYLQFHMLLDETHAGQRQVRWYADKMNITPSYLNVICKHVVGKAPQQIINDIVIQEVKQRLLSSDESIKEVAFFMHFSSESSFSKFFRAQTGMSPTEFRLQQFEGKG